MDTVLYQPKTGCITLPLLFRFLHEYRWYVYIPRHVYTNTYMCLRIIYMRISFSGYIHFYPIYLYQYMNTIDHSALRYISVDLKPRAHTTSWSDTINQSHMINTFWSKILHAFTLPGILIPCVLIRLVIYKVKVDGYDRLSTTLFRSSASPR